MTDGPLCVQPTPSSGPMKEGCLITINCTYSSYTGRQFSLCHPSVFPIPLCPLHVRLPRTTSTPWSYTGLHPGPPWAPEEQLLPRGDPTHHPQPQARSEQEAMPRVKPLRVAFGKELFDSLNVFLHKTEGISTSFQYSETVKLFISRESITNSWIKHLWNSPATSPRATHNHEVCEEQSAHSQLTGYLNRDSQALLTVMYWHNPSMGMHLHPIIPLLEILPRSVVQVSKNV